MLPVSAALLACKRDRSATTTSEGPLDPSESVDPAFSGCRQSCGLRSAAERARAKPQPGANTGDTVFCPVSGAAFRVNDNSPHRTAGGQRLFFCCESCATFFSQHEAEVLKKRGLASS
jgi:YHS domain-containing protein